MVRSHRAPARPARATRRSPAIGFEYLESRTLMAGDPVSDDFNDNNDTGWQHYAPLAPLGAPGTYDAAGGVYHIAAAESTAPDQAGPGRAGSLRPDASYTDFRVSVDIVDWDSGLNQAFGLLARTTTPGLGTTNGYALSYATNGDLDITKLSGEQTDDLDPAVDIFLDPNNDYRLVFEGRGDALTGSIYNLADLSTPLAITHATDATWASGTTGVFVYANQRDSLGTADATFDNFSASVAPPVEHTIAYWRFEEGTADQQFTPPSVDGGPDSGLAVDSAGLDDPLRTFFGPSAPFYKGDVPAATVPATGAANHLSLDFTPNQDIYTAQPGTLNAHPFDQFTIEASFMVRTVDAFQNIVGKDGKPLETSALAPLQFKVRGDTHNLQIEMLDANQREPQVQTTNPIVAGRWYNAAAVNDGTHLSLYLDDTTDAQGYVLQGTVDAAGLLPSDATWDVGRGFFNGNITDWVNGRIDEVRISDIALDPSQFLFAQPTTGGPAHVTNVYVSGGNWADSFKQYLAAQGLGSAQYGYSVPATDQLNELPWTNLNQVSITFDQDVTVAQDDLSVRGVTVPNYSVTAFTYTAATKTATWTLGQNVVNDKLIFDLDADAGGVTFNGAALDGEWNNAGDTFPSGDNAAGGDFKFRVNVLPGDVNRDSRVNAVDLSNVRARQLTSTSSPGTAPNTYNAFSDVNGSGNINAVDLSGVRANQLKTLPGADPTASVLLGSASLSGSSITKDLFGSKAVL